MKKTMLIIAGIVMSAVCFAALDTAAITIAPTTPWIYGAAGGVTQFPPGDTVLTDTLVVENQFGPVVQGAGRFKSRIIWKGPPGKPVIEFRSCNHPILQDLTIHCQSPCRSCVCVETSPKPTVTNTCATIQRVWFECANNATDCIEINNTADGGTDNNGECHFIYDCQINDFKRNGVGIYTSQSHRCHVLKCQIKTANVSGTTGVYARFGSQTIERCNGGGLDLVVFASDQYAGLCEIINNNFEGCKRFCDCRQPSGQWYIANNRCDGMTPIDCSNTDPDKVAVFAHGGGDTLFARNFFASRTAIPVRVLIGYCTGLEFRGNRFNGAPIVTVAWGDVKVIPPTLWLNNFWQNPAGNNTLIPHP